MKATWAKPGLGPRSVGSKAQALSLYFVWWSFWVSGGWCMVCIGLGEFWFSLATPRPSTIQLRGCTSLSSQYRWRREERWHQAPHPVLSQCAYLEPGLLVSRPFDNDLGWMQSNPLAKQTLSGGGPLLPTALDLSTAFLPPPLCCPCELTSGYQQNASVKTYFFWWEGLQGFCVDRFWVCDLVCGCLGVSQGLPSCYNFALEPTGYSAKSRISIFLKK